MVSHAIEVNGLTRVFQRHERRPGLRGAVLDLVNRQHSKKTAVDDISFTVAEGEIVGFLGPNGAGKTTTLKMLSGLLHPTSGRAMVLGYTPWERKHAYLKQISLVMGQKNQLWWDLPAMDSFRVHKEIYEITDAGFSRVMDSLPCIIGVESLLNVPVRRLSLGERMKMELIAALLHSPKVVFLDEPTIGLDVVAQRQVHEFLKEYNRTGATIMLTSHYMGDVKALAERVIIINHGVLAYDGRTDQVAKDLTGYRLIRATFDRHMDTHALSSLGEVVSNGGFSTVLKVAVSDVPKVSVVLVQDYPLNDFTVEEVALEDVLRDMFRAS